MCKHTLWGVLFIYFLTGIAINAQAEKTVAASYPGLSDGVLGYAQVSELPPNILVRTKGMEITSADLETIIKKARPNLQGQLRKNAFWVLEQVTGERIISMQAQTEMQQKGKAGGNVQKAIEAYMEHLTAQVTVTPEEITQFYEQKKDLFCGATQAQMENPIRQHLLQEKRQEKITEHLKQLGQTTPIFIAASWVKEQAVLAGNNPLDRARSSDKPSLVVFGGASCCGPDKMLPVVEALREKYPSQLNVVHLQARDEEVLAMRYHVRSIPTEILYDKAGKEIWRYTGLRSLNDLVAKLSEIGVK